MRTVLISAALRANCSDPYMASGVWQVTLDKDYPPRIAAGVAIDVFVQSVRLHDLEDFVIKALDPLDHAEIEEADEYDPCSRGAGEAIRIADESLRL